MVARGVNCRWLRGHAATFIYVSRHGSSEPPRPNTCKELAIANPFPIRLDLCASTAWAIFAPELFIRMYGNPHSEQADKLDRDNATDALRPCRPYHQGKDETQSHDGLQGRVALLV